MQEQAMFRYNRNACSQHKALSIKFTLFISISMARPRKKADEKRNIPIAVKLNQSEHKKLVELMEYAESSASEVIRQLVFKKRILKPKKSAIDVQTYTELRRIGNNLNQYVKQIHQRKISEIDRSFLRQLQELLNDVSKRLLES